MEVSMIIKEKWKRLLWFGLLIIFVVLTALYGLLIKFQWAYRNIPTHHFIGNRPSTVSALKEQGFPFSFLVI